MFQFNKTRFKAIFSGLFLTSLISLSGCDKPRPKFPADKEDAPNPSTDQNQAKSKPKISDPAESKPPGDAPEGMVWIPGGEFTRGSLE